GPLLAALDASQPELRGEAATLLAHLGTPQGAPLMAALAAREPNSPVGAAYRSLTRQSPTVESAEGLLNRSLDNLRGGVPPFGIGGDGRIDVWLWDSERQLPVKVPVDPEDAIVLYGARLTRGLAALRPERSAYRVQAASWTIEAGAVLSFAGVGGLATPASLDAMTLGERDQVLAQALNTRQTAPAVAALAELTRRRDPATLYTPDGRPSPAAEALRADHPRVRYAALQTIAAI